MVETWSDRVRSGCPWPVPAAARSAGRRLGEGRRYEPDGFPAAGPIALCRPLALFQPLARCRPLALCRLSRGIGRRTGAGSLAVARAIVPAVFVAMTRALLETALPPQQDWFWFFSLWRRLGGSTLPLVGRVGAQRRGGGSAGVAGCIFSVGGVSTTCFVSAVTPTRVASRRDLPHRRGGKGVGTFGDSDVGDSFCNGRDFFRGFCGSFDLIFRNSHRCRLGDGLCGLL